MNTILEFVVSLLAGIFAFAVVTVGFTVGLEPWFAFSLLIALPVGLVAGLATLFVAYVSLWYRDQAAEGSASRTATGLLWAAAAVAVDLVAVLVLGLVTFFALDAGIGIGLLVAGLPVTLVLAAVVGYLASVYTGDAGNGGRPAPR